ncbi:MAG: lysostaphin resistance A-like protein [Planctomycetota bacterium]
MRTRRERWLAGALVALLGLLSAAPPVLAAPDGDPLPAGVPAPDVETGGAPGLTTAELEKAVSDNPAALWASVLGKVLPAVIGGVLLIRMALAREKRLADGLGRLELGAGPTVPGTWPVLLGLVVGFVLLAQIAASAVQLMGFEAHSTPALFWATAIPGVALGVAVLLLRRQARRSEPAFEVRGVEAVFGDEVHLFEGPRATRGDIAVQVPRRTPHGRAVFEGLKGFALASALVIPLALVWALVLRELGVGTTAQEPVMRVAKPGDPLDPWFMAVLGIFVAPFWEEAFFRGTLYPLARRWFGGTRGAVLTSALISSALFAAVHANLAATVPLFVLALVLTWVFERTNSLLAVTTLHAAFNATSLLPLFLISGKV